MAISIQGSPIDDMTRCIHYHSPLDIIAIKFKCCNEYYPCYNCHQETTTHDPVKWTKNEQDTKAILCGNCKQEMTISQYLSSRHNCPFCQAPFNPRCSVHYDLYFDV